MCLKWTTSSVSMKWKQEKFKSFTFFYSLSAAQLSYMEAQNEPLLDFSLLLLPYLDNHASARVPNSNKEQIVPPARTRTMFKASNHPSNPKLVEKLRLSGDCKREKAFPCLAIVLGQFNITQWWSLREVRKYDNTWSTIIRTPQQRRIPPVIWVSQSCKNSGPSSKYLFSCP